MNEFLFALIGIVVIANLAFTIWSYISLRRLIKLSQNGKSKDIILLDHIVHMRSSINLIYASIATITFVLAFLGFNLKDKVTQDVTKEISAAARVDLDALAGKANNIAILDSVAKSRSKEYNSIIDKARSNLNELNNNPQSIYVIQDLLVTKQKHYFKFSELQTINGNKLPKFSQEPVIISSLIRFKDAVGSPLIVRASTEGFDAGDTGESFNVDLCIYPRR